MKSGTKIVSRNLLYEIVRGRVHDKSNRITCAPLRTACLYSNPYKPNGFSQSYQLCQYSSFPFKGW